MKFIIITSLILLSLSFTSVKADLLSATQQYNNQNFKAAYQEFYRLAELGNKDAIYNIGVMHLHGQGVKVNREKSYAWFRLAADFGLGEANNAANLIAQELQKPSALQQEYQSLLKNISFTSFENELKPVFNKRQFDSSTHLPPQRVFTVDAKYPKEAYEKGIEGWVWLEFDVDQDGLVTDIDIIDAFPDKTFNRSIYNAVKRWKYQPHLVNGEAKPYSSRSLLYHFTTFKGDRYQASFSRQKKEYQRKISRLIEGAEQGNALVQYYIANWMNTDEHNATKLLKSHWQEPTASSELLLSSAINGYANSQYRLGSNLLRGEFTKADRVKGLNWILHAAQSGFSFAQYRLARELLNKQFVEYDPKKAKRWLIAAADQGHFRAIRDLVTLLRENNDLALAKRYLALGLKMDKSHSTLLKEKEKLAL